MNFKSFKLGKPKDKDKGKSSAVAAKATQIAEMEEQLNDRTDDLKQTEKKLKKLSGKVGDLTDVEVRPHGPMLELNVDPGDPFAPDEVIPTETTGAAPLEGTEEIKLVEVKTEAVPADATAPAPAPASPPAAGNLGRSGSIGDSLKDLFTSDDDEENPLANLIYSLPEVTINELEDDLKEIKNIIKDWQKK